MTGFSNTIEERLDFARKLLLNYADPLMRRLMEGGMTSDEAVAEVLNGRWYEENVPGKTS